MSNSTDVSYSKDLWERAKAIYLATLQSAEERSQVERYFSMITRIDFNGSEFNIFTINKFTAEFLQTNYAERLKSAIDLAGGNKETRLNFQAEEEIRALSTPSALAARQLANKPKSRVQPTSFVSTIPLTEEYTFEEFVLGPSNSFAHAAAMGAVNNPGKPMYNPLFIHGGPGLGKTHLMQAIGNELHRRDPSLAICYLTAETFLNEYVNYLHNGKILEFRAKYRDTVDVLLLDDVQFLNRGKEIQEEFFNTFNALQGAHKQIVMTSDVAPKNLPSIEQRLISRFEGGIVQEIESPGYETRLAILKKKAESLDIKIAESVLEFIADNIKSHVRAMEGALGKVSIYVSSAPGTLLDNEKLSYLLRDFIEKEQSLRKLTIEEIQTAVAKKYSVTITQILSPERTQSIVTPRQLAMYITRKYTTKSLPEIAKKFEKTHATVIHGVKNISKRLDVENDLKATLAEILAEFGYKLSDKLE